MTAAPSQKAPSTAARGFDPFDTEAVRASLITYLRRVDDPGLEVGALKRYTVGFSWVTFGFSVRRAGRPPQNLILRIDPPNGVIEVGFVSFSRQLKRTRIATEAQFLLMRRVFDELGYRRYEWKCDSLNAPSRAAAARLGFEFEGVFRQATVYKGRSRDTAWFSIVDGEWPALRAAYEQWLGADNFDAEGRQRRGLAAMIAEARAACA